MINVGYLVNIMALLIGFLGCSVLKVDISGVVKKKGRLQILDCKWCLEGLSLFQGPVHCSYIMEIYPRWPRITIIISPQLKNYVRQGWLSCKSGGTSCRLPGRFSYEVIYLWGGEEKMQLQVLDWKWCLEGLFVFQVPVHCINLVELYPS